MVSYEAIAKEFDEFENLVFEFQAFKIIAESDNQEYMSFGEKYSDCITKQFHDYSSLSYFNIQKYVYNDFGDLIESNSVSNDALGYREGMFYCDYEYGADNSILQKTEVSIPNKTSSVTRVKNSNFLYDEHGNLSEEFNESFDYDRNLNIHFHFPIDDEVQKFNYKVNTKKYKNDYTETVVKTYDFETNELLWDLEKISEYKKVKRIYIKGKLYRKEQYFYSDPNKLEKIISYSENDIPLYITKYIYNWEVRSRKVVSPIDDNLRWLVADIGINFINIEIKEDTITPDIIKSTFNYYQKYLKSLSKNEYHIVICIGLFPRENKYLFEEENQELFDLYKKEHNVNFSYDW